MINQYEGCVPPPSHELGSALDPHEPCILTSASWIEHLLSELVEDGPSGVGQDIGLRRSRLRDRRQPVQVLRTVKVLLVRVVVVVVRAVLLAVAVRACLSSIDGFKTSHLR